MRRERDVIDDKDCALQSRSLGDRAEAELKRIGNDSRHRAEPQPDAPDRNVIFPRQVLEDDVHDVLRYRQLMHDSRYGFAHRCASER